MLILPTPSLHPCSSPLRCFVRVSVSRLHLKHLICGPKASKSPAPWSVFQRIFGSNMTSNSTFSVFSHWSSVDNGSESGRGCPRCVRSSYAGHPTIQVLKKIQRRPIFLPNLGYGALARIFVRTPSQKFRPMTKAAAGEVVELHFRDQLGFQRLPLHRFFCAPTARPAG